MKVTSINLAFSSQLNLKTGIIQRFSAICFKYRNFTLAIVSKLTLGLNLHKNGQPCLLDPQQPTTFSDEGCPFLSIVCETPALNKEGAWS